MPDIADEIADAIQQQEGKPGDKNYRNFNPGNLNWGIGMSGVDPQGYAIFPDEETGKAALKHQVQLNIDRGLNLNEFFGGKPGVYDGFAPKGDPRGKNDPKAYAQAVADKIGISPTDVLSEATPGEKKVAEAQQITKQVPDGRSITFPAGTTEEEADQYIKQYYPAKAAVVKQPQPKMGKVEAWAKSPSPGETGLLGIVNPYPAAKKITRAFYEPDFMTGASDIMEGAGTMATDVGIALALMSGVGEVGAGVGAVGRALLPHAVRGAEALVGSQVGGALGSIPGAITGNEKAIRFGSDVGGWAGGILGAKFGPGPKGYAKAMDWVKAHPEAMKSAAVVAGRGLGGALLTHLFGGGPGLDIAGGVAGAFFPEMMQRVTGSRGAAPTGPVTSPGGAPGGPLTYAQVISNIKAGIDPNVARAQLGRIPGFDPNEIEPTIAAHSPKPEMPEPPKGASQSIEPKPHTISQIEKLAIDQNLPNDEIDRMLAEGRIPPQNRGYEVDRIAKARDQARAAEAENFNKQLALQPLVNQPQPRFPPNPLWKGITDVGQNPAAVQGAAPQGPVELPSGRVPGGFANQAPIPEPRTPGWAGLPAIETPPTATAAPPTAATLPSGRQFRTPADIQGIINQPPPSAPVTPPVAPGTIPAMPATTGAELAASGQVPTPPGPPPGSVAPEQIETPAPETPKSRQQLAAEKQQARIARAAEWHQNNPNFKNDVEGRAAMAKGIGEDRTVSGKFFEQARMKGGMSEATGVPPQNIEIKGETGKVKGTFTKGTFTKGKGAFGIVEDPRTRRIRQAGEALKKALEE